MAAIFYALSGFDCKKYGGMVEVGVVSPDGVAPSRMVVCLC